MINLWSPKSIRILVVEEIRKWKVKKGNKRTDKKIEPWCLLKWIFKYHLTHLFFETRTTMQTITFLALHFLNFFFFSFNQTTKELTEIVNGIKKIIPINFTIYSTCLYVREASNFANSLALNKKSNVQLLAQRDPSFCSLELSFVTFLT